MLQDTARRILGDSDIEVVVEVEGTPRPIATLMSEEITRITEEFLQNTRQHSHARRAEIALSYRKNELAMRLSDDGKGIGEQVLQHGRSDGHFGLIGMRERARKVHAEFTMASRAGMGVEALIVAPAHIAYADYRRSLWGRLSKARLQDGPAA